jgi:hypothetical protein
MIGEAEERGEMMEISKSTVIVRIQMVVQKEEKWMRVEEVHIACDKGEPVEDENIGRGGNG